MRCSPSSVQSPIVLRRSVLDPEIDGSQNANPLHRLGDPATLGLCRRFDSVRAANHPPVPFTLTGDTSAMADAEIENGFDFAFDSTLYLDADTVVYGESRLCLRRGRQFSLAFAICECPWLRRYGQESGSHGIHTGVVFFSSAAREVFSTWERSLQRRLPIALGHSFGRRIASWNTTTRRALPRHC